MRRALLGFAFLAVACPSRHDTTVNEPAPAIRVVLGAASRWSAALGPHPDDAGEAAKPVLVHVMRDGEELGGPNAIGRPGDLVLENDEVVFVIDRIGSSHGFAESGGNVVDAADARTRRDELGQMFTYFGAFPRQAVYETMSSGGTSDGAAWIEATGRELREPTLAITTQYTLRPPDRALLIETSVENTGTTPTTVPGLGDAIQWGAGEKVAPGKAPGFKGKSNGPYVGAVGRFTSYAVTSTEGAIAAVSGGSWTDTTQRQAVALAPHESTRYARVLLVGARGDTSSIVGELAQAAGAKVGTLRLDLPDGAALPTGAVLRAWPEGALEPLTLASPFAGSLPVGAYAVALGTGAAGVAAPEGAPADARALRVEEGVETRVDVPVVEPAAFEVRCVGTDARPLPCKVTFTGSAGTATPDFGPSHLAGPARNQATTADGSTRVELAAGSYAVTASRGPEYTVATATVRLQPGEQKQQTLALRRVVDTRGYVACDFHQHSMMSADAPVAALDRVISNAAEGVEVAVATEHNAVVDLEPLVREQHLERELVELSGDELTSDADQHAWGHANVFPMAFDPAQPRGGSPPLREAPSGSGGAGADLTPGAVFAWVRAHEPGDHVVQVNHPRSGSNGYFDLLKFDRTRGEGTDPAYSSAFDAVEVWNGRNVEARSRVVDDWRALLRTGHPTTPTANTDTHGIVGQEAGYPRTMVRVKDDTHLEAWDAARTADLLHGVKELRDVVLTNGPMLRVTANGAPVGGVARGPAVTVRVHVESAPWVDVDTVRVVRVGDAQDADAQDHDKKAVTPAPLPDGAHGADVSFTLNVAGDDAIFVIASGAHPMTPVLAGDEREIRPWAMTGAIWVRSQEGGQP